MEEKQRVEREVGEGGAGAQGHGVLRGGRWSVPSWPLGERGGRLLRAGVGAQDCGCKKAHWGPGRMGREPRRRKKVGEMRSETGSGK